MINKEKIDKILQKVIKEDMAMNPEMSLVEDLNLNSLQMMEIIGLVEKEFKIFVPVNKTAYIKTVGDLYSAIEKLNIG